MYGILWTAGAIVTATAVPMGTFNGAHMIGVLLMVGAAALWMHADYSRWKAVDTIATEADLRLMDELVNREAFKASRRLTSEERYAGDHR